MTTYEEFYFRSSEQEPKLAPHSPERWLQVDAKHRFRELMDEFRVYLEKENACFTQKLSHVHDASFFRKAEKTEVSSPENSKPGHPGEEELQREEHVIESGFPGLYGRNGALPEYFTEEMLKRNFDRESMRAFLDFHTQRLYELLQQIHVRYGVFRIDPLAQTDEAFSQRTFLNALIGRQTRKEKDIVRDKPVENERKEDEHIEDAPAAEDEPVEDHAIKWEQLLVQTRRWSQACAYRGAPTLAGLEQLIGEYLGEIQFRLKSFYRVVHTLEISKEQREKPMRLGVDAVLGNKITVPNGLKLSLLNLKKHEFTAFQESTERKHLSALISDYTRNTIKCRLFLQLRAADVVPVAASGACVVGETPRMGRDSWLASKAGAMSIQIDGGWL